LVRKKKLPTLAALSEKAAKYLQKLVRMKHARADGTLNCVSCGKELHWKEAHGAHFIPRGIKSLKLMEENIHPSCPSCNNYRNAHHDIASYRYYNYMLDRYGEEFTLDLLRKADINPSVKWNRDELSDFIFKTRLKIADEHDRLMLTDARSG
jgi:hypothetical protein